MTGDPTKCHGFSTSQVVNVVLFIFNNCMGVLNINCPWDCNKLAESEKITNSFPFVNLILTTT